MLVLLRRRVSLMEGTKNVEENAAILTETPPTFSTCEKKRTVRSVIYQLVRVDGDGRLVPATHDEVMEVEHTLHDSSSEQHIAEGGSEDEILKGVNSQLEESTAGLVSGNASQCDQLSNSNMSPELTTGNPSTSKEALENDISLNAKPDFSLLKKEICLDTLTIRELQETFRAAFGRHTSVKDKLWLKRRITMGLTNSCDVPSTSFILKERKIVKTLDDTLHQHESREHIHVCHSTDEKNLFSKPARQMGEQLLSGKILKAPQPDCIVDSVVENNGSKRVRKPTKRYIEELSDVDTKECKWRSVSSIETSGCSHPSKEARLKPTSNIEDSGNLFTRQDSLGGSLVRISYVSRGRRRHPRKDFLTLVDQPALKGVEVVKEPPLWKEHDVELEAAESARRNSDDNSDGVPTSKGSIRRKRAWTIAEVVRLVENISSLGPGRWSEIKKVAFASYTHRTPVDLKDKWRNLLKASLSQEPKEHENQQSRKHNNSLQIPAPILARVRELAEKHGQSGTWFGPGKIADHAEKVVQENGSGLV